VIGYLHTGMEKTGEQLTYMQGGTNVTRMDYLSPLNNELVFSMAVEKLLGIDGDIPERAVWMRMLLSEMNRMSSHLLFLATNGMDIGAVSMMLYGWREREEVLRFFQKVTGLRMNHNFIRPGGLAADLPAGWRDDVLDILEMLPARLEEYEILMNGQPIWRDRLQGVRPGRSCVPPVSPGTSAATCRTCATTRWSSTWSSASTVTHTTATRSA
jgi:NADH-quinone oxidoreductase subunit D